MERILILKILIFILITSVNSTSLVSAENTTFFIDRRDFHSQPQTACVLFFYKNKVLEKSCTSNAFNTSINKKDVNKTDYIFFFETTSPTITHLEDSQEILTIVTYISENKILSTTPIRKISKNDFITLNTLDVDSLNNQITNRKEEESELQNALEAREETIKTIYASSNQNPEIQKAIKKFEEENELEIILKAQDQDIKLLLARNQRMRSDSLINSEATLKAQLSKLLKNTIEGTLKK